MASSQIAWLEKLRQCSQNEAPAEGCNSKAFMRLCDSPIDMRKKVTKSAIANRFKAAIVTPCSSMGWKKWPIGRLTGAMSGVRRARERQERQLTGVALRAPCLGWNGQG